MFFIAGSGQKEKKLEFRQPMICPCCSRYGSVELYKTYQYISLFFIPVFTFGKQYTAVMNCCHAHTAVEAQTGKEIEHGDRTKLSEEALKFPCRPTVVKHCQACGFETRDDFEFCPKCGKAFSLRNDTTFKEV